jgi:hypothetical protein
MRRPRITLSIAAALAMSLTGCGGGPGRIGVAPHPEFWSAPAPAKPKTEPKTEPKTAFAPACPTPTDAERLRAIEAEIEEAIKAGASPDTLATEWERLDEAARICRKGRP